MSQASNHITWCLNKAKKEGKKHRGLVQTDANLDEAKNHLSKAEHNLNAISYFSNGGFSDWSASAAFYTIYHCFLAILAKHGYESRNQECTISVITYLKEQNKIELEDKFIEALRYREEINFSQENSVIELREDYQYGTKKEIDNKNRLLKIINLCLEIIEITKDEIYKK